MNSRPNELQEIIDRGEYRPSAESVAAAIVHTPPSDEQVLEGARIWSETLDTDPEADEEAIQWLKRRQEWEAQQRAQAEYEAWEWRHEGGSPLTRRETGFFYLFLACFSVLIGLFLAMVFGWRV